MKNILKLLFSLILLLFFVSCEFFKKDYYIMLKIDESANVTFDWRYDATGNLYLYSISVPTNTVFSLSYFLVPETDKDIEITSIVSSDENILEITNINHDSKSVSISSKSQGKAKVTIKTAKYGTSSTRLITVKD